MWAKSNMASGIVFLALGTIVLAVLIPYGIEKPASLQFLALSPSFWPNTVGVVISLIGLALIASSFSKGTAATAKLQALQDRQQSSTWLAVRPFVVMAICFVLYLALQPLGFVLTTTIAMVVLMLVGGERRLWLIALTSILTPLALYIFFTKATGVPIPAGVLEPLLLRI
ncbi:MAG: tripartite tricarboxylate transporter TctB family protein [Hyphomicrobiaceae bacterium]